MVFRLKYSLIKKLINLINTIMETQLNITEIGTPDDLWRKISVATKANVPEKTLIREGAYEFATPENPIFVVGAALRQLFGKALSQVRSEIPLPAEKRGMEDKRREIERQQVVRLTELLREKMGQIVAGNMPDELKRVRNMDESPLASAKSVIGDTGKNIGHFVSLVMEDVFQEKQAA